MERVKTEFNALVELFNQREVKMVLVALLVFVVLAGILGHV